MKEEKFYTCRYDRPFKEIMLNEENKDILKWFLETTLKVKIDEILFSDKTIKEKRIAIKKLKLEPKFVNMFMKEASFRRISHARCAGTVRRISSPYTNRKGLK